MSLKSKRELAKYTRTLGSDWLGGQAVKLGNYEGRIRTDTPGELYARQVNGRVIKVVNTIHAPDYKFDLHVWVRRSRLQPTIWQITEILEDYEGPAGGGGISSHHAQHEFGEIPGPDTVWINRKQILQLTVVVSDPEAFIVQVFGSVIRTSAGLAQIANQELDLSSYIPTAGARFVTIQSSEAGVLSVVSGTVFASPPIGSFSDVPEADSDKYMLAFILLFEGMEELLDRYIRIPYQFHPGGTISFGWGSITGDLEDQTDLQSALDAKEDLANKDTDTSLAANSDVKYSSQKAVKTYIDALIAANDALVYKGAIDASANPNYPAASAGHAYRISVAGKIGGASGPNVEVGDLILCTLDGSASGDHATVGANWNIIQSNLDGAVIGPSSAVSGQIATFSGTSGRLIQDGGVPISSLQPIDADLTAIAGLTPTDNDILQRKTGAWINRSPAQLMTDLEELIQDLVGGMLFSGDTGIEIQYIDLDGNIGFILNYSTIRAEIELFNDGEGAPEDPGSAAADGTSTYAARRDHVHKGPSKALMIYLTHALSNSIAAGATNYLCPFDDGVPSTTQRAMVITRAATIKNFYVRQVGNQPAGGSLQCYVRKETATDEILITIAAGAAGGATRSNTSTAFTVTAGQFIGFKFVNNAPANPSATLGFVAVEVEFDP